MSELHCPQCQALIEQDFGMITCHQCGSVLMVNIDGQIELAGESSSIPSEAESKESENPDYQDLDFSGGTSVSRINPVVDQPAEPVSFQEEIKSFGNSETSDGPLSYTLIIEGIDTSELRQEIKGVLSDPKFMIDVSDSMKKIVKGRLELPQVNAVKASLIVQRLRETSLKISWRQHAFFS